MRLHSTYLPVFLIGILVLCGCSKNGNNPVVVDTSHDDPTSLSEWIPDSESGIAVLGSYDLIIDPDTLAVQFIPERKTMIGESYLVSGTSFFIIYPCVSCLRVKKTSVNSDGLLEFTLEIDHPFEKGTTSKPPSASNRLDLDIFDLALIIVPTSLRPKKLDGTWYEFYSQISEHADGYTRELAYLLDNDAACPYFLVVDNSDTETNTNNRFAMGTKDKEFKVYLKQITFQYKIFLTMGYGASAKKATRLTPQYYLPEFNRKSAWKVEVTPPEGEDPPGFLNTWNSDDSSTPFYVTVKVYDWQQGAHVTSNYPDPNHKNYIPESSNVDFVVVSVGDMTDWSQDSMTPDSGSGTPTSPLIYKIPISNENLLSPGEYTGVVEVYDERYPIGGFPGQSDSLIHSPNGKILNWYEIPEYATYQLFKATVVPGGEILSCDDSISECVNLNNDKYYAIYLPPKGLTNPSSVNLTVTSGLVDFSIYGKDPGSEAVLLNQANNTGSINFSLSTSSYSCIVVKITGRSTTSCYTLRPHLTQAVSNLNCEVYVATDNGTYSGNWPVYDVLIPYEVLTIAQIQTQIAWNNNIFSQYGYRLVWDGTVEIMAAKYYILDSMVEENAMHEQYGLGKNKIALYFVDDLPPGFNTAYCHVMCDESYHNLDYVYSLYGPNTFSEYDTVAHEHGHGIGYFFDSYAFPKEGVPCGDLDALPPNEYATCLYVDPLSCYYGNLMFYTSGFSWEELDITRGQNMFMNGFHYRNFYNFPWY
jgi:hypothetical protein